jgi:hypothetical protein
MKDGMLFGSFCGETGLQKYQEDPADYFGPPRSFLIANSSFERGCLRCPEGKLVANT